MDKMMQLFIKEPEREFHVRELAKLLRKSPTTISKNASQLKKEGLLLSKKLSNLVFFKANSESSIYKAAKKEHNLREIASSGLIDYLDKEFNNPEAIVLYGSYAKGEDSPNSDIDIMIVSSLKKDIPLEKFEAGLKRRLHLIVHSKTEIELMKKSNKELLNSLVNGLVVKGYWEVFK